MENKMRYILERSFSRNIKASGPESQRKDKFPLSEGKNGFTKNIYHNQILIKYNFEKGLLILLFFMTFLSQTSICKKAELNALNNDNYIVLKIKGIGQQYLLSHHMPDYVEPVSTTINGDSVEVNRTHYLPEEINTVVISWGDQQLTSCYKMFEDLVNIVSIDLSNFDFTKVTTIESLCQGCAFVERIVFKDGIIENEITSFESAFRNCKNLQYVNVGNLKSSKVTTMENMFWECNSLVSLDLTNYNTLLVNNTNRMFSGCKELISLNLSNFETPCLINMIQMFRGCLRLSSLDIRNFKTENVISMDGSFFDCKGLTLIDLSHFYTPSLTSMKGIFLGCDKATSIDIRNFNTTLVTNMNDAFALL